MVLKPYNRPECCWLFDFDLTLYGWDEEQRVLRSLDAGINEFIRQKLKVGLAKATEIRDLYWKKYGTTVAGLMMRHGVDPDEYFNFVHTFQGVNLPMRNDGLSPILQQVRGRRMIFSNGRMDWVKGGLRSIGIGGLFETIYDLKRLRWQCKPSQDPYAQIEQELGVHPSRIILLDDSRANLATAKRRGWKTVWVHPDTETQLDTNWTAQITAVERIVELL